MLLLNDPPATLTSRTPNESIAPGPSADVADYYRQTIEDYKTWSPESYMHFGLWRRWLNPFRRRPMLEAMNDLVFESLHLKDDQRLRIADLGCGVGAVSRYGSRHFPGHLWQAVTICPEQVAYGRARLDPLDEERVQIIRADYCELPFADASLDAAFFLESLCHADHPHKALKEVSRVLKPGGRLVVVDGLMRNMPRDTPTYVNAIAKKTAQSWAVGSFHNVPEFEKAASDCGLAIKKRRELGWQIAACVAHSPLLIGWHSMKLIATGRFTAWKRKHMIGCSLGVLLGMMRQQFGYYLYSLRKGPV